MKMPWRWAAAITSSPGLPSMPTPSTVIVTVVFFGAAAVSDTGRLRQAHLGAAVLDVVLELVPEQRERRRQGGGGRRAEHADRGLLRWPRQPGADVVGHIEQEVQITGTPVAVNDPAQ